MGARTKRARKTRLSTEFSLERLVAALSVPKSAGIPLASWTLPEIFAARDAQLRGDFRLAARLAESMRTDDALAPALENRLAPQRCVKVEIVPAEKSPKAKCKQIAEEADALFGQSGVGITSDTVASIHACLVNHDVAFGCNTATVRADGSRIDVEMHAWPIELVRWHTYKRCFVTRVESSCHTGGQTEVEIVHGDGRWVIFQRFEIDPFKHGAILSAALVWARHAYGIRDWAKSSLAHGNAKMMGEMPENSSMQEKDEDGNVVDTPEAVSLMQALREMVTGESPVCLLPAGAKAAFVANSSTNWQVFSELVVNAESAAARIYLGTDGTMGSKGGAPGVDIQSLFGVAATKVESDLKCIQRGIDTGVIEPWTAMNWGDSSMSPSRRYMLPDADADAERASVATRTAAFFDEIEQARKNGFEISQAYVDSVAKKHGIEAPTLPVEANKAPTIALAPTDIARVVTVNEARASAGVGPLTMPDGTPDPDGRLTVEQFAVKKAAEATAAAAAPPAAPAPAPTPSLRLVPPPKPEAVKPEPQPEPTAHEEQQHRARMTAAYLADVRDAKAAGVAWSQEQLNELAATYGVPAPKTEVG